jgi:ArsR family transcriptional regulator
MSSISPKQAVFDHFAQVAKALGHGHRLAILEHLAQGERSVDALARLAGLSMANTSQHLKRLRAAGLVQSRKDGKHLYCRLSDDAVVDLLSALRTIAEHHLAEVEKVVASYFRARDSMEPVSHKDLVRRIREGTVTLLDVRPEDEFRMAHIPGAINIPLKDLEQRLGELPSGREVIAYCRGPYCVFSYEAVAALRDHGFRARRMADGYPEWKAAGHPVETAADD